MPIFKIELNSEEYNEIIAEHPELVNRTRIADDLAGAVICPSEGLLDDNWAPDNPWLKRRYESLKSRYTE